MANYETKPTATILYSYYELVFPEPSISFLCLSSLSMAKPKSYRELLDGEEEQGEIEDKSKRERDSWTCCDALEKTIEDEEVREKMQCENRIANHIYLASWHRPIIPRVSSNLTSHQLSNHQSAQTPIYLLALMVCLCP